MRAVSFALDANAPHVISSSSSARTKNGTQDGDGAMVDTNRDNLTALDSGRRIVWRRAGIKSVKQVVLVLCL
jgi:hypothetical protein